MENNSQVKVLFIENRFVVRGTQEEISMFERGIETRAQDMLDIGKDGKAKLVLIKKNSFGTIEIVNKPIQSNLTNYTKLVLIDLEPTHLTASVEETKAFINEPTAKITRYLSSGARFTEEDLKALPKEAHHLIYKEDSNGARTFNVINVQPNEQYKRYGIKSQIERNIARTLVFYCTNAEEMTKLSIEQRKRDFYKYNIVLVEFKPNEDK